MVAQILRTDIQHDLWHNRLGQPRDWMTQHLHKCVEGVPKLNSKNHFHKCSACITSKMTKHKKNFHTNSSPAQKPNERFMMDYGFVRGKFAEKNKDGTLITSKNGYNCYLLIQDEYSKHIWTFLFATKDPPIDTVKMFLDQYGNKTGMRKIRTDNGGELAKSGKFRNMVKHSGYILETTAPESSFQNGQVERTHRTLSAMMRSMLSGAALTHEYWSYALIHAVYLRNRLPHKGLPPDKTPLELYTGRRPSLSHLKVFGSLVYVKTPKIKKNKLDTDNITTGIFLHFTSTDRNVMYEDATTSEVKSARHAVFDELHYSALVKPTYASAILKQLEDAIPKPKQISKIHAVKDPMTTDFNLSSSYFGQTVDFQIQTMSTHDTLGLNCAVDDKGRIILIECLTGTPAAKIPKWRSTLRKATILSVNGYTFDSIDELKILLKHLNHHQLLTITFAPVEKVNEHPDSCVPQLHFDQMSVIAHQHMAAKHDGIPWKDPHNCPSLTENAMIEAVVNKLVKPKITRQFLCTQKTVHLWEQSEFKQLDQYHKQGMFGSPCKKPYHCNILPLLWVYLIKTDGTLKARCVCNGSPRQKGTVTLGYTYAATVDQAGSRTFWALSALHNNIVIGADATNAFGEAQAPKAPLFVTIDEQYRNWWQRKHPDVYLPKDFVLPVLKALQGHPEAPRLWGDLIHQILTQHVGLSCANHEPCLYRGTIDNQDIFLLRQVDDFAISAPSIHIANQVLDKIQEKLQEPLKRLGTLSMYNGLNIHQSRHYIRVSCETYLTKILQGHGWFEESHKKSVKTPVNYDTQHIRDIETTQGPEDDLMKAQLQQEQGFSYRQALGELLFAAVTCRPDIFHSVIKLSKFSTKPAAIHYHALKRIFRYLRHTLNEGLHYWRPSTNPHLPNSPLPTLHPDNHDTTLPLSTESPMGYVDADWASDVSTRKSVSGASIFLAGAPVIYKSRTQPTVSLSSTESEFISASEGGKLILYLRSILNDIGIHQTHPTPLYADNEACISMANAKQPTRRTRHLDIKYFALLNWIETDQIIMTHISTSDNPADALTKTLGTQLFSRHSATLLGKRIPSYCRF